MLVTNSEKEGKHMKLIRALDYRDASQKAADAIAVQIAHKPNTVLGLATGGSPVGIYESLIEKYRNGLDFSQVRTVNLDEYVGLTPQHPQSYAYYMNANLFNHINIAQENIHIPDGTDADTEKQSEAYDQIIRELGGIDLQLVGIGHNGHIGFNEPSTSFTKGTHCVDLADTTIAANARFFECEADVPRKAYTMGIQHIMQAKKVVMIVCGSDKAKILQEAFFGPVTPAVPASILQFHPDFTLVADEDALQYFIENSP